MDIRIHIKRVYETGSAKDGYRILVDRLWPRGIKKEDLRPDEWAKDLAPSTALRKWFGHRPELFAEFSEKYRRELATNHRHELQRILEIASRRAVTLLYSAKDEKFNQAQVLRDVLIELQNATG